MSVYNEQQLSVLRSAEERVKYFKQLAKTGIHIAVYVCPTYEPLIRELVEEYPNVRIQRVLNLSDTQTYMTLHSYKEHLPEQRSEVKDTFEYLTLMNAKMEFVYDALQTNTGYENYAWIDFNIWYIIRNSCTTSFRLRLLADCQLASSEHIYMPGCWNWKKSQNIEHAWKRILWRFCGGFFIGHESAMRNYCQTFLSTLPVFIEESGRITWEVNMWHLMEARDVWSPIWFSADHNDDIIAIPIDHIITDGLIDYKIYGNMKYIQLIGLPGVEVGTYSTLPRIKGFSPSSIAYCNGTLNVRYVNYELTPGGAYIIHHPEGHLYTKNIACQLNDQYEITGITIMLDKPPNLVQKNPIIEGVEDIRLFERGGELRFIGTQREFSEQNVNRMIVGDYNSSAFTFENSIIVEPPTYTGCEKNWVPISIGDESETSYIYSWGPMRIGKIIDGKLEIQQEIHSPLDGFLSRMKGSSIFVREGGGEGDTLLGVIHYSEEGSPRKYFHCLLRLDRLTLRPIAVSHPFIFQRFGIEFCIGFTIESGGKYRFWYSQHDKDPAWCSVPAELFQMYSSQ